jgi:hypothetical protein
MFIIGYSSTYLRWNLYYSKIQLTEENLLIPCVKYEHEYKITSNKRKSVKAEM